MPVSSTFEPLPEPKPKKLQRNWYMGPNLNDIVLAIIRRGLVTKDDYRGKQPPPGRYFEDEVIKAQAIHDEWAEVAFDLMMKATEGTEVETVVEWIGVEGARLDPEEAKAFNAAGIRPRELEWFEAESPTTFRTRYWCGELKMAEVVEKIRAARQTSAD